MQMAEFHSFLFLSNILVYMYVYVRKRVTNHIFIPSFVDGYLGCFHSLAIINNLMLI